METKQLTKQENIMSLYGQLNKAGQRGDAQKFIAHLCGVKLVTVKNHWLNEFPDHLTDDIFDKIIDYLQKQVAENNKVG